MKPCGFWFRSVVDWWWRFVDFGLDRLWIGSGGLWILVWLGGGGFDLDFFFFLSKEFELV